MDKYGHAFEIPDVGLNSGGRTDTGSGCAAFGTCLGLYASGNGHGGSRGIKFKAAPGKFIISPLVLEKDDLGKGLPPPNWNPILSLLMTTFPVRRPCL